VAKAALARACQKLGISINRTKTYKELEKSGDTENLKAKLAKDPYFGVSLDEEACTRTADPQLIAYANVSSLMTVVNDHIPNLLNGTKAPIQPSFSVLVDTGRTACKGHKEGGSSYGFQVQNVRRLPGIRECFIPRPGYVYVDADYTGLELHTWAQVCYWLFGFSHMGGALNKGLDPHLIIAAHMLGQDYDTTLANYKEGCPEEKEARQFGKIGNFGLMGGMGIATFISWSAASYGKILTVEQATKIKEAWLAAWPEAKEYFNHVSRLLREGGDEAHVVHFKSNRHRGPLRFTQTANTFFQGLGADAAKAALYEVVKSTFVGELVGCHVVNFVHDEILLEAPEDFAVGALETLSRIMVETAHKWLPDVKPKVDGVLMRRWSKEAKKVFDSNGNLIPWDW
jgi:DNA polymerase I-like protein with 3'-5' exonuclease and polymerase domains